MAYIEKTVSAEETVLETKAEPEPVYIDEVFYFIMLFFFFFYDLNSHKVCCVYLHLSMKVWL